MCVKVLVAQSCLAARLLCTWASPSKNTEGVAVSFRVSSWPRDWTWVPCIAGSFFTVWVTTYVNPNIIFLLQKLIMVLRTWYVYSFFSLLFNSWYVLIRIPAGLHIAFCFYVCNVLLVYRFIFLLFIFLVIY